MLGVTNTKYAFRQHLSHIGFLMDHPHQVVAQELMRYMGTERYACFQQLHAASLRGGQEEDDRVYDFMQDLQEANLLRCMVPDVTLDTSYFLYEKALPLLTPGKRLLELGCWTGGLASFIAENHPDCTVVGADRVPRILELNRVHYRLPNLSFALWDYRHDKPEELEPADILLCGMGTTSDCPPGAYTHHDSLIMRSLPGYLREKQEARRYFLHWRQAVKDGGVLLTVLRISTFARFLASVDAAHEAGWTTLWSQLRIVSCPMSQQKIPSLAFTALPSQLISEDIALAHWTNACLSEPMINVLGAPALALYRALGDKQVLAIRECLNMHSRVAREEVGICGAIGYIFGQDDRPDYALALITVAQAENQRKSFQVTPEQHHGYATVHA
jgi:hypothetical protein